LQGLNLKWITVVLYVLQFEDRCLLETTSRATWTQNVENDLKAANIGLYTAWRRAQCRADWMNFVTTTTLMTYT